MFFFFFSSRRRHTRSYGDWSSDVCSSDLAVRPRPARRRGVGGVVMAVIERDAKIVNPLGMHARPAAEFVKLASRCESAVEVRKDDLAVNGKSIMGVMMLAAECGSSLSIK